MINCKKTAIYMRLSKEDNDRAESESISNQRKLICRYAKDVDIIIKKEYVDDGYSGTNFNRPAFQEMIKDIESGKIDSILVKDLSRFARETIDASDYIDKYFPEHRVRFISILDNIDTYLDKLSNELIQFKLYNNQKFARDTSKKLKKTKHSNMIKGLYLATYVAYGYQKDDEIKGKIVIDECSSKVVKKIFTLYLSGKSSSYIATYLTNKKIKTPAEYLNIVQYKKTNMYSIWKRTQILRILKNEVYIGNTVRNVENKLSYYTKGKRKTKKEEWMITKNTHDPIVSKKDFETVQKMIESKNGKAHKLKYDYLLRPYMYCGKCGRKISFSTRGEKQVGIRCPKSIDNCCEHYYYNYFKLEKQIIENVKKYYNELFEFSKAEDNILSSKRSNILNNVEKNLKSLTYELNRMNDNIDDLYLKKLDGIVTQDDYKEKMIGYNAKRDEIDKSISECNLIKTSFNESNLEELKSIMKSENKELKSISRELLDKLIYRIELSKSKIEVKYKFRFFY